MRIFVSIDETSLIWLIVQIEDRRLLEPESLIDALRKRYHRTKYTQMMAADRAGKQWRRVIRMSLTTAEVDAAIAAIEAHRGPAPAADAPVDAWQEYHRIGRWIGYFNDRKAAAERQRQRQRRGITRR